MVPDMHNIAAIEEEEDEENVFVNAAVASGDSLDNSVQHDGEPDVQAKTQMKEGTDPNNDWPIRPSPRAIEGPIKSSLKSSATSITSIYPSHPNTQWNGMSPSPISK